MSGDHLAGAFVGVYSFVVGQKLRFLWDGVGALSRDWRGAAAVVAMIALALVWPFWPLADLVPAMIGRRQDFKCKTCGWLVGARWRWLVGAKVLVHLTRSPECRPRSKP